jgi:hypothetical protein
MLELGTFINMGPSQVRKSWQVQLGSLKNHPGREQITLENLISIISEANIIKVLRYITPNILASLQI